ncbi:hypothetical protein BDW75DRAFT_247203 [Aspergillus navahoensis]
MWLVPGFSGWGVPLFGAINYWGGIKNVPAALMEEGYTVIVAQPGPFSSNGERACELFSQLTCGKFDAFDSTTQSNDVEVDYSHVLRSTPGVRELRPTNRRRAILFSKTPNDGTSKAHFICHSQGGNTVLHLLSSMARKQSPFDGAGDGWALSVTTLGTPHRGTTIIDVLENLFPGSDSTIIRILGRFFAIASFKEPQERFYDPQLDHWAIRREGDETFQAMCSRMESEVGPVAGWYRSNCNAFYDNSIKGMKELHTDTPLSRQTYYFSLSFHSTVPFPSAWPSWTMDAARAFPIPMLDFLSDFLDKIPDAGIGRWVLSSIAKAFVDTAGWVIILSHLRIRDIAGWVVGDVLNRILRETRYPLALPLPGKYLPRKDVLPLMLLTVYAMGSQDLVDEERRFVGADAVGAQDWHLNDGVVNTASMCGPVNCTVDDADGFKVLDMNNDSYRGKFWHFGVNDRMDHADQIGVFVEENTASSMMEMYSNLAKLVTRLPGNELLSS